LQEPGINSRLLHVEVLVDRVSLEERILRAPLPSSTLTISLRQHYMLTYLPLTLNNYNETGNVRIT